MATTIKRVNLSTRTQKTDSLEFNGWKLTFQYSFEAGKSVNDVQVNGNNSTTQNSVSQPYMTYSKNGANLNISFVNTECDNELVALIKSEVDSITSTI